MIIQMKREQLCSVAVRFFVCGKEMKVLDVDSAVRPNQSKEKGMDGMCGNLRTMLLFIPLSR